MNFDRCGPVLLCLIFVECLHAQGILLRYRFKPDQVYLYRTNRQDSISAQSQMNTAFRFSMDRVRILQTYPDQSVSMSVITDSVWIDADGFDRQADPWNRYPELAEKYSGQSFRLSVRGIPLDKKTDIPFMIIPLPENPVSEGTAWDFEIKSEFAKPLSGWKSAAGQCLFYGVVKENNVSLAVMMIRIEILMLKKWDLVEPFRTLSHELEENRTLEGVAYLDMENGCMVKMVFSSKTRSAFKIDKQTLKRTCSSRITIRLIEE